MTLVTSTCGPADLLDHAAVEIFRGYHRDRAVGGVGDRRGKRQSSEGKCGKSSGVSHVAKSLFLRFPQHLHEM